MKVQIELVDGKLTRNIDVDFRFHVGDVIWIEPIGDDADLESLYLQVHHVLYDLKSQTWHVSCYFPNEDHQFQLNDDGCVIGGTEYLVENYGFLM